MRRLQSVLNAAARLISNWRKFDHITPVLRDQLHRLPIRQRIDFKIAVLICLQRPSCSWSVIPCNLVRDVGARAHLRFAIRGDLTVPRIRTRRFGPRSFRVLGPVVWNSLPEDIRIPELADRVNSNIGLLVYKCLHGLAPGYSSDQCIPASTFAGRDNIR